MLIRVGRVSKIALPTVSSRKGTWCLSCILSCPEQLHADESAHRGDAEIKTSVAMDWKSGEWTRLRFQIRKIKDGEWKIEGKAWQGASEPKAWTISCDEKEEPVVGKASVLGSPFSGTPIWFDDLRMERIGN